MESMRLVYDVVAGVATTDGFGKLATDPPFHLATVSSPTKCRVDPPLLTRRNWWWFCLRRPSCDWAIVELVEVRRKSTTELTSVECIVYERNVTLDMLSVLNKDCLSAQAEMIRGEVNVVVAATRNQRR